VRGLVATFGLKLKMHPNSFLPSVNKTYGEFFGAKEKAFSENSLQTFAYRECTWAWNKRKGIFLFGPRKTLVQKKSSLA
jgi:hypothetical protein